MTPLDVDAVLRETEALAAEGVESLAIVFLHAYANPAHEHAAAEAIARRFPALSLSLSADIAPEICMSCRRPPRNCCRSS